MIVCAKIVGPERSRIVGPDRRPRRGMSFVEVVAALLVLAVAAAMTVATSVRALQSQRELLQRSRARQVLRNLLADPEGLPQAAPTERVSLPPWAAARLPKGEWQVQPAAASEEGARIYTVRWDSPHGWLQETVTVWDTSPRPPDPGSGAADATKEPSP